MSNANCLEGIACPGCGQSDRFFITAQITAEVTDAGADIAPSPRGDVEWDDSSPATCPECNREGPLREFRTEKPDTEPMRQQVEVTLKLSLWLDATMDEDEIVTHVRASLPKAFGEELTVMDNPVDILNVREEAEIFGNLEVPSLRQSLEAIAQLPLWGEQIEDAGTRKDYAEAGEYDLGEDCFTPSVDTESSMLRDAVEGARAAIARLEGRAA